MHLLSIPSEKKSTSFQMCVYLKKSFVYKSVCVVFIFQTKNTDAAFRPPPPLGARQADAQEPTSYHRFDQTF